MIMIRVGDWTCPNTRCLNHTSLVFARRKTCPHCGAPKPANAPSVETSLNCGPSATGGVNPFNQKSNRAFLEANYKAQSMPFPMDDEEESPPRGFEAAGNDWTCKCGQVNFRRDKYEHGHRCKKCGNPRKEERDMDWGEACKLFQSKVYKGGRKNRSRSRGRRSSSSSSSSSSSKSKRRRSSSESQGREKASSSAAAEAESNPEIEQAKKEALEKCVKLRDAGLEVDEKRRQWRLILREYHPDKHEDKELATAVFQFLQKARPMMGV